MITNKENITIFHKTEAGTYETYETGPVFHCKGKNLYILKGSIIDSADIVKIYIPKKSMKEAVIAPNDLLITDKCDFIFDNSSEKTISESIKSLKSISKNKLLTVQKADENLYGSEDMQHYYIEAGGK